MKLQGGELFPENYLDLIFSDNFTAASGLDVLLTFTREGPVNYERRATEIKGCLDSFIRQYPQKRIAGGIVAPPVSMAVCFARDDEGEVVSAHLFDSHGHLPHSRAFLMSWDRSNGNPVDSCANFLSRLGYLNTCIFGIIPLEIPSAIPA